MGLGSTRPSDEDVVETCSKDIDGVGNPEEISPSLSDMLDTRDFVHGGKRVMRVPLRLKDSVFVASIEVSILEVGSSSLESILCDEPLSGGMDVDI